MADQNEHYENTSGHAVNHVERHLSPRTMPSGRTVYFYSYIFNGYIRPGVWGTIEQTGFWPSLACSCQPANPLDIHECTRCLALVCHRHAAQCAGCGNVYCGGCLNDLDTPDGPVLICGACRDETLLGRIGTWLKRTLWD